MKITIEEIAKTLGRGKETKMGDGGWKTRCPSHDDKTASLSLRSVNGKILVRCHAGCTQDTVIKALQEQDLWPTKPREERDSWKPIAPVPVEVEPPENVTHQKLGKPSRQWVYKDLNGRLVGYIFRFDQGEGQKTLLPMSYCENDKGQKRWQWKSFEKPRPLYRLHKLKEEPTKPVALFEGEKAADEAEKIFGKTHICMSWPGGAKAVKYTDFRPLRGRDVYLWPDADEPGQQAMDSIAEILVTEGAKSIRMVTLPDGLPKGWDVADSIPEDFDLDLFAMLANAVEFQPSGDRTITEFNRRFALVLVGDKTAVIRETYDARSGKLEMTYLSPTAFSQFFSNKFVTIGRAEVSAGKYWLSHEDRRSYEGIVFQPGIEVPGYYNLWRGFSVEPDPTGDWSMFREHLFENVCEGSEELFNWVFGWFAHIFKHPAGKIGTSLSLRGTQGTGKTIIGKTFGRLIQQHYTLVDDPRYVLGNFNAHLASTLLLHSDEGFWGGDPRYVGKLKSLVTSETQRIEQKGKDSYEVQNFLRLFITTNQDWVVPAAFEERRFAVLDMGREREQDREYFGEMIKQLKNGGYSGLLHDLLEFDLSKTDIGVIPNTKALRDQKEMSMSWATKFWFTCLMDGEILPGQNIGWPDDVISSRLYEVFIDICTSWGVRHRPSQNEFFKDLRKIVPENSFERFRKSVSGQRVWCYKLPNLQAARKHFDELNETSYDWPEDADVSNDGEKELEEIPF